MRDAIVDRLNKENFPERISDHTMNEPISTSHMSVQWWLPHLRNVVSQSGEDGVLEAVFAVLPEGNRWACEFGAWDGKHLSNTYNLVVNHGWSAALIEASARRTAELRRTYANIERVICINEMVDFKGSGTLDNILSKTAIPKDLDLLSIDIDGNDYHVWAAVTIYEPKVVIVEYNPTIPNHIEYVQPANPDVNQGNSLLSLVLLGKEKGYELIAVTDLNAIFVRHQYFPLFKIEGNAVQMMRPHSPYEMVIFQLYDGTIITKGCNRLIWQNVEIDPESIQVMPKWLRGFPPSVGYVRRLFQQIWKLLCRTGVR